MKKIGTVLMIVGAMFIALVVGLNIYSEYKYNSLMDGYVSPSDGNIVDEDEDDNEMIFSDTIGVLEIPSINLKNPILDGIGTDVLRKAVGRFTQSSAIGSTGTTTLIGHNKYILNQPFKRLDEVEIGEEVKIYVEDNEYNYIVREIYTVLPSDTGVLAPRGGDYPALILITCTDNAEERYVVEWELMNPNDELLEDVYENFYDIDDEVNEDL